MQVRYDVDPQPLGLDRPAFQDQVRRLIEQTEAQAIAVAASATFLRRDRSALWMHGLAGP